MSKKIAEEVADETEETPAEVTDETPVTEEAPIEPTEEVAVEEPAKVVVTAFPSALAAIAILAAKRSNDRFSDENDNEAIRLADGSVRLSIKLKEGGHQRVVVKVPEKVGLIVVEDLSE